MWGGGGNCIVFNSLSMKSWRQSNMRHIIENEKYIFFLSFSRKTMTSKNVHSRKKSNEPQVLQIQVKKRKEKKKCNNTKAHELTGF